MHTFMFETHGRFCSRVGLIMRVGLMWACRIMNRCGQCLTFATIAGGSNVGVLAYEWLVGVVNGLNFQKYGTLGEAGSCEGCMLRIVFRTLRRLSS